MPLKCNNIAMLMAFVKDKHSSATVEHPTKLQTKFTFTCGLVMNVFNTGTVNFQGNSHENRTASDLMNVIDAINR